MPPLSLAAYRYFLAALILTAALGMRRRSEGARVEGVSSAASGKGVTFLVLMLIGLCMYGAQGVHMSALSLLSASDSGLVSMTWMPIAVVFLAFLVNGQPPRRSQLMGLCVILAGLYVYFPTSLRGARLTGIGLNILSSSMWAVAVIFTHRTVNSLRISSLALTTVTMLSGSAVLLAVALLHDRAYIPSLSQAAWLAYLAVVNTAIGFALYNHTMKSLGAFEIAVFQDSMIIQIGILSAIFLGDKITPSMALGMVLVSIGIAVVQVFAPRASAPGILTEGQPAVATLKAD